MRLSEKGCVHLNEWMVHRLPIEAFEFKPEDFTGAIVLTVNEAKGLLEIARDYRMYLFERCRIDVEFPRKLLDRHALGKMLEQMVVHHSHGFRARPTALAFGTSHLHYALDRRVHS